MYSSVVLSLFTWLYNQSPEYFHLAKYPLKTSFPPFPSLWQLMRQFYRFVMGCAM